MHVVIANFNIFFWKELGLNRSQRTVKVMKAICMNTQWRRVYHHLWRHLIITWLYCYGFHIIMCISNIKAEQITSGLSNCRHQFWKTMLPDSTSEHLFFKFFVGSMPPSPPRGRHALHAQCVKYTMPTTTAEHNQASLSFEPLNFFTFFHLWCMWN